ncbi:hypothetical protein [Thiohalophilus sp.]|uniref:hypothetical protein n=1 Tax=Thiohalophilus sp. TaxID=3028392 RepID=UPI002ACE0481|nr:hypothetical protein [Thiohalophilus sp.]MDZ7804791.1 hypothetical protein [Thiohalophilus sp.]
MITGFRLPVRLGLAALILALANPALAGRYKCWTNDEGVRECGQSVPPEYSQQRIEILNDQGVVIDVEEPAKTPEQLEAEKRAAEQRRLKEQQQAEQKRRDQVLLNTFTTERDLKLYYENKTAATQSLIDITRASNEALRDKLGDLQKQAANQERRGKELSEDLLDRMEQVKRRIANNKIFMAEKAQELDSLQKQFEVELARFRKLKSAQTPR